MLNRIKNLRVPPAVIKSQLVESVIGPIATKMHMGQNQTLQLVELSDRLVLIPPLSGSSTLSSYATRINLKKWSIKCSDISQVLAGQPVTFVMRPDFDRLLSFFNKKIRNPTTAAKYCFYLGFENFSHDMTFALFLHEYASMRSRGCYLDKHLLLNKDFLDLASTAQISISQFSEFFSRPDLVKSLTPVNSSIDVANLNPPYNPTIADHEIFNILFEEVLYKKKSEK